MDGHYDSSDEYELGKGEVIGPDMTVAVVIRWYDMPLEAVLDGSPPIKFVPVNDVNDEFDVAVYVPSTFGRWLSYEDLTGWLSYFIRVAGITYHESGPEAVSRLG